MRVAGRSRCKRRRQVGALRALRRLQAQLRDRVRPPGVRSPRAARVDGFLDHQLPQGSEPRAHLRLHAGRGIHARRKASRSAAGSTTRSCWTSTACSTTDGLRYDDEFVRHKMLDAIGDLYLLGQPLIGEYTAFKSGHGAQQQAAARAARGRTRPGKRSPSATRAPRRSRTPPQPRPRPWRRQKGTVPRGRSPCFPKRAASKVNVPLVTVLSLKGNVPRRFPRLSPSILRPARRALGGQELRNDITKAGTPGGRVSRRR